MLMNITSLKEFQFTMPFQSIPSLQLSERSQPILDMNSAGFIPVFWQNCSTIDNAVVRIPCQVWLPPSIFAAERTLSTMMIPSLGCFINIAGNSANMEFSKPESFAKQISIYLKSQQNDKAYGLAHDFVHKFPQELIPHVLLAESSFRLGRHEEAKFEAKKGLRLAATDSDIVFCTMVFSSACFQLKDYIEGYETLKKVTKGKFIQEVEEALLIFSLAMMDEQKALQHMKNLIVLNREKAMD